METAKAGSAERDAREEASMEDSMDAGSAQGREIVNPVSGERIVIRQSGEQTGGQLLVFDLYLPPHGHVPAPHAHPIQEERFTVLAGQMRFRLRRRTLLAGPGDVVVIPRGAPHWFSATGDGPAHARVEVRPALRMRELFESTGELGHVEPSSAPVASLVARLAWLGGLARLALDYQREVTAPFIPAPLMRLALAPVAWLGRLARRDTPPASTAAQARRR